MRPRLTPRRALAGLAALLWLGAVAAAVASDAGPRTRARTVTESRATSTTAQRQLRQRRRNKFLARITGEATEAEPETPVPPPVAPMGTRSASDDDEVIPVCPDASELGSSKGRVDDGLPLQLKGGSRGKGKRPKGSKSPTSSSKAPKRTKGPKGSKSPTSSSKAPKNTKAPKGSTRPKGFGSKGPHPKISGSRSGSASLPCVKKSKAPAATPKATSAPSAALTSPSPTAGVSTLNPLTATPTDQPKTIQPSTASPTASPSSGASSQPTTKISGPTSAPSATLTTPSPTAAVSTSTPTVRSTTTQPSAGPIAAPPSSGGASGAPASSSTTAPSIMATSVPTAAVIAPTVAPAIPAPPSRAPTILAPTVTPAGTSGPTIFFFTFAPVNGGPAPVGSSAPTSPSTQEAPTANNAVRSSPFATGLLTTSIDTPSEDDVQAASTIIENYLKTFFLETFGLGPIVQLDDFVATSIGNTPGSGSTGIGYDAMATFGTGSEIMPTQSDIDVLIQTALSPPSVSILLQELAGLPSSNPLATVTEIVYSTENVPSGAPPLTTTSTRTASDNPEATLPVNGVTGADTAETSPESGASENAATDGSNAKASDGATKMPFLVATAGGLVFIVSMSGLFLLSRQPEEQERKRQAPRRVRRYARHQSRKRVHDDSTQVTEDRSFEEVIEFDRASDYGSDGEGSGLFGDGFHENYDEGDDSCLLHSDEGPWYLDDY